MAKNTVVFAQGDKNREAENPFSVAANTSHPSAIALRKIAISTRSPIHVGARSQAATPPTLPKRSKKYRY